MNDLFFVKNDPLVQEAIDLLTANEFVMNATWILNTPVLQPKIKFTGVKGLKPQLAAELGIKAIEDQRSISYNGKVLQFVICDILSSQSFKTKKAEDARVLYIIHNDELVLERL